MAKTSHPILALLLFHILFFTTAVAGRHLISNTNLKHPESLIIGKDRGYLIPGLGRGILSKCKDGFNPFTYNPVTGDNTGIVGQLPSVHGGGTGVEKKASNPGNGGSTLSPVSA